MPVLGDFTGYMRPWGHVDFGDQSDDDGKPPWASFAHAFPHNAMFLPYNAGALATCEYVSGEMGFSASGEARCVRPRVRSPVDSGIDADAFEAPSSTGLGAGR